VGHDKEGGAFREDLKGEEEESGRGDAELVRRRR